MKTIVFLPEMKAISGTRSIDRNLVEARDGRDLDKVLASAGTIQIMPKDALKPLGQARKAVDRVLLRKGTRFFGGFMVADAVVPEVQAELEKISLDFEAAKARLITDLPGLIALRVSEAPEWEDVIRANAPSTMDLAENISFGWVKAPIDLADPEIVETLKGDPLAIKIAREMAQMASTHLSKPQTGKKGISGLSVLQAIRVKAQALSFIDSRLGGLVAALDAVICDANVAKGTPTQSASALVVGGVLQGMTKASAILAVGEAGAFDLPSPVDPILGTPLDTDGDVAADASVAIPVATPAVPVSSWAF